MDAAYWFVWGSILTAMPIWFNIFFLIISYFLKKIKFK